MAWTSRSLGRGMPCARSSMRCARKAGVSRRLRAEVDDMAMLRLIARDSEWLTVLPKVVVQDELRVGVLVTVGDSAELQERLYAITTPHRHRIEWLDRLLSGTSETSLMD